MVKVVYDKCTALENRAIEDRLISELAAGESIIRMYEWTEPGISIGNNLSKKRLLDDIPIDRRVTGGSASYLGCGELCYTVLSKTDQVPSHLLERIHAGIINELREIGIDASMSGQNKTDEYKSVECFNSVGKNEIVVDGKKLVGSAVTRVNGVYIHNSVMYMTDSYKGLQKHSKEDSTRYGDRITSIGELGVKADLKEMQVIIARIITQVLMEE